MKKTLTIFCGMLLLASCTITTPVAVTNNPLGSKVGTSEGNIFKVATVSEAIKNSRPHNAKLLTSGNIEVMLVSDLSGGDLIGVSPGEIIPIDGVIISGSSSTNEDFLTGESKPINKNIGDSVLAGSINLDGYLEVEVKSEGASTYDFIEKLILEAQSTTPSIQKTLDKVTQFFVPGILILSFTTFMYRYFILSTEIIRSLEIAISVLVIACPCALGLATPIVLYRASTLGYKDGFIFKITCSYKYFTYFFISSQMNY